ncbi:shikimate dehydrogenase [Streptomyces sp. NPDC057623]|uniref:shikimate dehydrogenase n=1 Tax=Streptomyces sp. NPDC057623 TaxID=3346187 RepID=UPI0036B55DE5
MSAPARKASYLVGLIGSGIGGSFSPALHKHEADRHGLRYIYRLIDLDRIGAEPRRVGELLKAAHGMGFRGLNITHPCKQLVIDHLDELSPQAEATGAVNTVVFEDGSGGGRAVGHNTDVTGFAAFYDCELTDVPRDRVVQLGCGGAGAAVAHALLGAGSGHLTVVDPLTDRAVALADSLNKRFGEGRSSATTPDGLPPLLSRADGLVHASPTGTAARPGLPLPADLLHPGLWVVDIVYRPLETELLHTARARGCVTKNGVGMVVFQAADAFQLFTGRKPDRERMLAHAAELDSSE